MCQGGNFSFKSCQGFGLKDITGEIIPIRNGTGKERVLVVLGSGNYGLYMYTISMECNVVKGDVYQTSGYFKHHCQPVVHPPLS